ncbi:hypothetical protein FRB96_002055 [Tulasnella sp. 330]|nr:hypothetical protein FRB96_002055 [Tulasnella sp. 330]KAG8881107.1 hypothetical protein FRB97_000159 [Tulasnella sp. 331]KAG8884267.1 hypothetical protein FRB98_002540 [Tulasnella sp. 332]
MQRVLEVPELLGTVFDQSDRSTLVSLTRVSRSWNELGSRRLWQNINSLTPLFEILAPLEKKGAQIHFREPITAATWQRFKVIASYVKSLVFDAHPIEAPHPRSKDYALSKSTFIDIAIFKPSGDLLPNLRQLDWKTDRASDLEALMLFLSSGLRELKITILSSNVPDGHILRMIDMLSMRMPSLKSLSLRSPAPPGKAGPLIAQCIGNCPSLEEVHLPPYHMVPQIVGAMGMLPSLKMALVIWGYGEEFTGVGDQMEFQDGWFPLVEHLQFDTTLNRAIELMSNPNRPPQVAYLTISIRHFDEDHQQLKAFFAAVADAYPKLLMLTINLLHQGGAPSRPITFDVFRPALELRNLLGFEVSHNSPAALEQSDIEEMGYKWPRLRTLRMCADPVITPNMPDGLPLSSVECFAKSFPFINHLALYISTSSIPTVVPYHLFSQLQNLHVGTSPLMVKDIHPLAAFFCKLLNTKCALVDGRSGWHPTHVIAANTEPTIPYEMRETLWKEVTDIIETAREGQREGECRINELETELEACRRHALELQEKLDVRTAGSPDI